MDGSGGSGGIIAAVGLGAAVAGLIVVFLVEEAGVFLVEEALAVVGLVEAAAVVGLVGGADCFFFLGIL